MINGCNDEQRMNRSSPSLSWNSKIIFLRLHFSSFYTNFCPLFFFFFFPSSHLLKLIFEGEEEADKKRRRNGIFPFLFRSPIITISVEKEEKLFKRGARRRGEGGTTGGAPNTRHSLLFFSSVIGCRLVFERTGSLSPSLLQRTFIFLLLLFVSL